MIKFFGSFEQISTKLEDLEERLMNLELRILGLKKPSDAVGNEMTGDECWDHDDWAADLGVVRGDD